MKNKIDKVNSGRMNAAIGEYLNESYHRQFLVAEGLQPLVRTQIESVKGGVVSPHLVICCCCDTFVAVMAGSPVVKYVACSDKWPDDSIEEDYRRGAFPKDFAKMSDDEKFDFLVENDYCYALDKRVVYMPDYKRKRDYAALVGEYLVTAAAFAKGVGSDAAEMFMEAYRLLQRRCVQRQRIADGEDRVEVEVDGLEISEGCAKAAYETAERAQGKLWVDVELAKLKPIRPPRKRRAADRS